MKKKSTNHSNFFDNDSSIKICDEVNCQEIGEYEAPKHRIVKRNIPFA